MTPEHEELLRRLFATGTVTGDPHACGADLFRAHLVEIEKAANRQHPDWIDEAGRPMLPRQIGCLPSEALDALVAFYLEHREAGRR